MIPTFKIHKGSVDIKSITVLQATNEVILLSIDCKQSHPIFAYFDGLSIFLTANRNTIITGKHENETMIDIKEWRQKGFEYRHFFTEHLNTINLCICKVNKDNQQIVKANE